MLLLWYPAAKTWTDKRVAADGMARNKPFAAWSTVFGTQIFPRVNRRDWLSGTSRHTDFTVIFGYARHRFAPLALYDDFPPQRRGHAVEEYLEGPVSASIRSS